MTRLAALIIADDLTGALDSVAPFASLGLDSLVATSLDALPQALALDPQVLSVNLGSREGRRDTAQDLARRAALLAGPHVGPDTIWFKKIDSRMKGHVAAEVAGVIAQAGFATVLLCPAIPDLGRIVTGGQVRGAGVADPIPVSLDLTSGTTVLCPDARSDADLDRLVLTVPRDRLHVGARGLAAALARHLRPDQRADPVPMPVGPVGFCIGSRDPITLAQAACLVETARLTHIAAPDGIVPARPTPGDVLVQATAGAGAAGNLVSSRLARGMLDLAGGLCTLVVSGGETAAALLQAAGIGVLCVKGEVLPGLPLCHAAGKPGFPAPGFPAIVTKSGGFGQTRTLLHLWQHAQQTEGQPCL